MSTHPATTDASQDAPIPAKILIADDDQRNLLAAEEILREPGIEIVLARSGAEVLRHVLTEDFAAILLDVQMPGMDGYEVASMVRARPRSSCIPIIFLTAYNKDDIHVFRGYSAGAVDYVFKPIEPLIIKSKVGVFVELYRKGEEIRRQAEHERALLLENLRVRSEKLEAERRLRRREEQQSRVLENLPIALYTSTSEGADRRLGFVNPNVERITGYPPARFEEEGFWAQRLHPDDRERVLRALAELPRQGLATLEYRWRCADESYRDIIDQCVHADGPADAPAGMGLWFDETDRKRLEQQLLHASKLEAVGRLTGGIAHDFNNMLAVVVGSLDLLRRKPGDEKAQKRITLAMEAATRCANLTKRLMLFSRRQHLESTLLDPSALARGLVDMLQRTIGDNVELGIAAPDAIWPVLVDRAQLEAALMNLAVNARDAMQGGGTLTIALHNLAADAPRPDGAPAGECVEIAVSDTGSGIPAALLDRVFEPFFTTKEAGRGTGLGLSMIYGFIKQSGGHVAIESVEGRGTTVRILLPRGDGEVEAGSARPDALVEPIAETARVLVVEDDEDVRQIAVAELSEIGLSTCEARDAAHAIDLLASGEEVDLVFSDVSMPGEMTGIDLAREVGRRWPDLPVLLTSGYAAAETVEGHADVLQKPYRLGDLRDRVAALIAERRAAQSPRRRRAGA
ncbi:response regulator [Salinarimonas sp.]|uniref:response regulator n=1 Tax=Salinarimonas sp. TaxID=2766526 RepID=UPI00391BED6D